MDKLFNYICFWQVSGESEECGERLCINHCSKKRETRDGMAENHWNAYRCYRKVNSRSTCKGQSTYNAEKVEEAVLSVVRSFFARIRWLSQDTQIKTAMRREECTQAKALKDAEVAVEKAAKAVAALEDEAIKALTGESRFDLSIINQLLLRQRYDLEQAK